MNKIGLIVKYSTDAFDEVYRAESRSSLLDGNKKLMQFTGAKTVKIAKFVSGGLYNYASNNIIRTPGTPNTGDFYAGTATDFNAGKGYGYQQSDMGIEWEEFTISIDRGAQYRVELFDNEETAQLAVGMGTTQINKQVIVPEIDAVCFSKIADKASATLGNLDSTSIAVDSVAGSDSPIEALNKALLWFDEHEVTAENRIIFASPKFMQALRNTKSNGLVKPLLQSDFTKDVKFTIDEYEGSMIVTVPPSRFFTDVNLFNGGFGPKSTSKPIDFMVVAKEAIYHIVKYNKIKVFGPEVVQDYDGYKINARIYHDVFIPDNKLVGVYVHVDGFTGNVAEAGKLALNYDSTTKKVNGFVVLPGSIMTDGKIYKSSTAVAIGTDKSAALSSDEYTLGTALSAGTVYFYVVDAKGVAVATISLVVPA